MFTPKQSQKILGWTIETALNLLVELYSSGKTILKQSEITNYFNQYVEGSDISSRRISRVSYELKRQKYIEIDEGDSVRLTDKAKIRVIEKCVAMNPHDKKRRLISFDIPETKRVQRNCFRRAIKKMGFAQIQKSLWVCDRNIGDLVEIAVKEFKVEEYVAYFVVETSNIDKYINKILSQRKTVTDY